MNFQTLDFSGPLDLLLHLVKESNIDILKVNLSDITDQYLKYLDNLKQLNLDIDSEYLVMASDLTYIKSKSLLPKEEEDEEEDIENDLIDRLYVYQKIKEISNFLKKIEKERGYYFSKAPSLTDEFKEKGLQLGSDITLDDLKEAYLHYFERKEAEKPLNTVMEKREYSVHKMNEKIMNKLNKYQKLSFNEILDKKNKGYVVTSFLSILDLARKEKIYISQEHNLSNIILERRDINEFKTRS